MKKIDLGKVRGTTIYTGSAITGTDVTGKTFPSGGITKAYAEDLYINTDTESESQGNLYTCITGGTASEAIWAYAGNIRGPKAEIVNDLESTDTGKALSAYQGKVLREIMEGSGLLTKEVVINYTGNVQGVKITTENLATIITVKTEGGDLTQEKAAGADTTVVSVVPAGKVQKIISSGAHIKKIELYNSDNEVVYTDNVNCWGAIEEIRQQVEESSTIAEGETTYPTGILSKIAGGIKKAIYPIGHAKAIWYSIKDNKTVYDILGEHAVNLEAISSILNKKELLTVISGSSSFEITRCFSYKNGNHIHAEIRGKVTAKISDATNFPFFYLSGGNIPFSEIYCGTFYSNNITFPGYAYIDTNNKYFKQNAISEISENTVIGFIVDFAI